MIPQRIRWFLPVFLGVVWFGWDTTRAGTAPANTDRVEEDWELVISNPSPDEAGPQITTTMSPFGDNSQLFFAFNVNYRSNPFRAGGLQVQVYAGSDSPIGQDSQRTAQCQTNNETVRWTQRMSVWGGWVFYDISNASSTTWGTFGQYGNLSVASPTTSTTLGSYSSDYTVSNSGVSWQANRVSRLRLNAVRYYSNGQLISSETTPRDLLTLTSE